MQGYHDIQFHCRRHPAHAGGEGVCAFCLRERLTRLVCSRCGRLSSSRLASSCSCSAPSTLLTKPPHGIIDVGSVGTIASLIQIDITPRERQQIQPTAIGDSHLQRTRSVSVERTRNLAHQLEWHSSSVPRTWKRHTLRSLFQRGDHIPREFRQSNDILRGPTLLAALECDNAMSSLKCNNVISSEMELTKQHSKGRRSFGYSDFDITTLLGAKRNLKQSSNRSGSLDPSDSDSTMSSGRNEIFKDHSESVGDLQQTSHHERKSSFGCSLAHPTGLKNHVERDPLITVDMDTSTKENASPISNSAGQKMTSSTISGKSTPRKTGKHPKLKSFNIFGRKCPSKTSSRFIDENARHIEPDCEPKRKSCSDTPDSRNTRMKIQSRWPFLRRRDGLREDHSLKFRGTPVVQWKEFDYIGDFKCVVNPSVQSISSLISIDSQDRSTFTRSQSLNKTWSRILLSPMSVFKPYSGRNSVVKENVEASFPVAQRA